MRTMARKLGCMESNVRNWSESTGVTRVAGAEEAEVSALLLRVPFGTGFLTPFDLDPEGKLPLSSFN